ncbi:MAG: ATP-binding protein [Candidatus Sulfotelmatobacter sp.]
MSLLSRHRWFAAAAGITLAFACVSFLAHKGFALTIFADLAGLALMLVAAGASLSNALSRPGPQRSFWTLIALGLSLWVSNQMAWCYFEIFRHREIPDPFFFDIILFFHVVPMIAAVAWRPDILKKRSRIHLSLINFLMLLGWWIFLYAFVVFPYQYVDLNVRVYNIYYDALFLAENILLIAVLALAALTCSGAWRRLYAHLLAAQVVYSVGSQFLDRAIVSGRYYSGSLYDLPFIAPIAWMAASILSARQWDLPVVEFKLDPRWKKLVPQLAMLAILSLPVLGIWTLLFDKSDVPSRVFRITAVLCAMLILGAFVFLRQYSQDQTLMALLGESRRAYEGQKQLQNQLVQQEKLASLGSLIAGAAREIDDPLHAVMNYSEQLWSKERLNDQQTALVRKIVNQAQRTRDLVANLMSFAQQAPGEKILVDLPVLLHRATHMLESRRTPGKVQVRISIDDNVPRMQANANQLFQTFYEIIENAMDAVEEGGGGSLEILAQRHGSEIFLRFSDTGPGVREPQRVFDPFYTTKPVGKGTGLGLSAVYGVIRDHGGQITCRNKPEGGAEFLIRLPLSEAAQTAGAAG